MPVSLFSYSSKTYSKNYVSKQIEALEGFGGDYFFSMTCKVASGGANTRVKMQF